jgi:hypothetical protein
VRRNLLSKAKAPKHSLQSVLLTIKFQRKTIFDCIQFSLDRIQYDFALEKSLLLLFNRREIFGFLSSFDLEADRKMCFKFSLLHLEEENIRSRCEGFMTVRGGQPLSEIKAKSGLVILINDFV